MLLTKHAEINENKRRSTSGAQPLPLTLDAQTRDARRIFRGANYDGIELP